MSTLSREEFYSIVTNLNEKINDYWAHTKELDRQREERERQREEHERELNSQREKRERERELNRQREREEFSLWCTERDKRLEHQHEEFNRWWIERDKKLEERDQKLTLIMQNSEKAARNAEELARRVDIAAERADDAAEKIVGLNRSFWLSTLTGSVTTILSVIAIAVGSYFATQQSNLSIVQTTLAAFQQGQNVWLVKPGK